jgi:hypothetical protein
MRGSLGGQAPRPARAKAISVDGMSAPVGRPRLALVAEARPQDRPKPAPRSDERPRLGATGWAAPPARPGIAEALKLGRSGACI